MALNSDDLAEAVRKLEAAGKRPRPVASGGYTALCPCHDDSSPSLTIGNGEKGVVFHCHAGCEQSALVEWFFGGQHSNGEAKQEVASWPSLEALIAAARPSKAYTYEDANGSPVAVALRFDPPHRRSRDGKKSFQKGHRRPDGRWSLTAMPAPRPLYRLPKLLAAEIGETVYIVEGEKCVETLEAVGIISTTSEGGSAAFHQTDWTPLSGRTVLILPDNDEAGEKYAAGVAAILHEIGCTVRFLRLPGLGPKEDVADFRTRFDHAADFDDALRSAQSEPWPPKEKVRPSTTEKSGRDDFPLDALGQLEPYIRAVAVSVSADPAAVATILLGTIAGAIGSSRVFAAPSGGFRQPSVLWCAVVAPSGDRKSAMLNRTVRPYRTASQAIVRDAKVQLKEWERDHPADDRGRRHYEQGEEPPIVPVHWFSDATIEGIAAKIKQNPRGLIRIDDELDSFFGGAGKYSASRGAAKAEMAAYRSMYDGAAIHSIRKGAEDVLVESAHCSIVGCVTPGGYRGGMTTEMREAGLAARFLVVSPDPVVGLFSAPPVPVDLLADMELMFDRMLKASSQSAEIRMKDEAGAIVEKWYSATEARRVSVARSDPGQAAALSKMTGTVIRLAGILQEAWNGLSKNPWGTTINADAARAAVRLADWYIAEERRAAQCGDDSIESQADADLEAIILGSLRRDKERQLESGDEYRGTTASELSRRHNKIARLRTTADAEFALAALVKVAAVSFRKIGQRAAYFL